MLRRFAAVLENLLRFMATNKPLHQQAPGQGLNRMPMLIYQAAGFNRGLCNFLGCAMNELRIPTSTDCWFAGELGFSDPASKRDDKTRNPSTSTLSEKPPASLPSMTPRMLFLPVPGRSAFITPNAWPIIV